MSKRNINFDKNSLVMPTKRVLKVLENVYKKGYCNPSSTYLEGQEAAQMIEKARDKVAKALNCDSDEIFFTSGASESISWVSKNHLLLADARSHHAVIASERKPRKQKDVVFSFPLVVSETGDCLEDEYKDTLNDDSVSLFVDLTQAIGKMDIDLKKYSSIKYACASGQKIGGISGAGILYIRRDCQKNFKPLIFGTQERSYRGGTSNLPAIVCFGESIEEATKNIRKKQKKIKGLIDYMFKLIDERMDSDDIDGSFLTAKPYIRFRRAKNYTNVVNITFERILATSAVQIFDRLGFNVSAGSACMSGSESPSPAYIKAGYTLEEAMRTIRISIDDKNTKKEIKRFLNALKKFVWEYDK